LKYYGTFTFFVLLCYVVMYLTSNFLGYHDNAAISLTTIAYLNLYVMILTILYLPITKEDESILIQSDEKKKIIHLDDEDIGMNELVVMDDEKDYDDVIIVE